MDQQHVSAAKLTNILILAAISFGLYLLYLRGYLLFHSFAEGFCIVIAVGVFMITWNSRRLINNNYLVLVGSAYLFIGLLDFIHTLAFQGMGVFHEYPTGLQTQVWIATRYMDSLTLLIAPLFLNRTLRAPLVFMSYSVVTALVLLSIFAWNLFPVCYVAGVGLTPFKTASEYIIACIFLAALGTVYLRRYVFEPYVFRLLVTSIIFSIASELCFTAYASIFDLVTVVGHLFKIVAYYLIYCALIETGLTKPYDLLFRELRLSEGALEKTNLELEKKVDERTRELSTAYETLRREAAERERLEEQLRQTQKLESIGTLAGGIAHDFNNILAAIIGFSEMAKEEVPEGSKAKRHLDMVYSAGLRGRDLVKQILTFAHQAEQEKKPLVLGSIIRETLKMLRATAPSTIDIRFDITTESGPVLADPTQIQQVAMNLCTNAIYAMRDKGGVLTIILSDFSFNRATEAPVARMSPGSYLKLSVADTGHGVPLEIMERIFDPFFTTKGRGEGTGLGLSVVHGILESHGGAMAVSSTPGKGSTFTAYLPKYLEHRPRESQDGETAIPRGSERVLFIDDETALAEMGKELLADLGYDVVSKTSSRDALALLKLDPSRFDVIITDQTMPHMTGIELAREISAVRSDIPIILCTGFSHTVDANAAGKAGIRAFVMKPLTKREIAKTIRKVLIQ